jgi:hypothetical protein
MAEGGHDVDETNSFASDDSGASQPAARQAAPAGWYPDPSQPGHHRYWTGAIWTPYVFPSRSPGPEWAPVAAEPEQPIAADDVASESTVVTRNGFRWGTPWSDRLLFAVALVVGLVVGFLIAFNLSSSRGSGTPANANASPAITTRPATTTPSSTVPADPSANALSSLVIRQSDVSAADITVQLIPGGDQVQGETTLDLCNGTFASEALRTARIQVAALDTQGNDLLSTEAVLYKTPVAAAQAFTELRTTAAGCPSTPVVSPVGEPTVTTRFNASPDANWPAVATVERLAYDFVSTDSTGQSQRLIGVYLHRGRALVGIYFQTPDAAQPAIGGQTTVAGIVNLIATRLAALPASVTG